MITKCSTTQKLDFLRDRQSLLIQTVKNEFDRRMNFTVNESPEYLSQIDDSVQ